MSCNEPLFTAINTSCTAVHVFDLGLVNRDSVKKAPSYIQFEFSEQETITELSSKMFSPGPYSNLEFQFKYNNLFIELIELSNNKKIEDITTDIYASFYSVGIVVLLIKFIIPGEFTVNELIEFAALLKGGSEKVNPSGEHKVICSAVNTEKQYYSFPEIYSFLKKDLSFLQSYKSSGSNLGNTTPFFYIQDLKENVDTKTDLIETYKYQLAGLANMWVNNWQWVRSEEVHNTIREDQHPLEYGFTIISPLCSFEIHPLCVNRAAVDDGRTAEEHHFIEWYYAIKFLEIICLQSFAMSKFYKEISKMSYASILENKPGFLRPFFLFLLALRLSGQRATLIPAIEDYWNIRLARRRYLFNSYEECKNKFLVVNTYNALQGKLLALEKSIDSIFNMTSAIFVLILTVIATIFGVLQVVLK